jgi:hypothetical protein
VGVKNEAVVLWCHVYYYNQQMIRFSSFFIFFILATSLGQSQQTTFNVLERGNAVQFEFAWTDAQTQPQSLMFSLPVDDLQRGNTEFGPFDNTAANTFAFNRVKQKAAEYNKQGINIKAVPTFSGYKIEGDAPPGVNMDEVLNTLHAEREKGLNDYLDAVFYTTMSGNNIMPNHKKIAKRYAGALAPLTAAISAQTRALSMRERASWIATFLQTIPYDTLMNRYTSNGAGFQTPYGLLRNNKGDCDTKAVAMLAILRGLYPTLPLTMVYVPQHAFVGIGIAQGPNDYALKLGRRIFVLADPTGPSLLKVGEVDEKALKALNNGQFSFQEVPF